MLRSNVLVDVASIENRKLASFDYKSAIHASSKDNDNTVEGTKFDGPRPQKDYIVDKIKITRMEEKTRKNITQSVSLQVTLLRWERIGNRTSDDESVGRHLVAVVVLFRGGTRSNARPACNLETRQAARYTSRMTARTLMNNVLGTGYRRAVDV